MGDANGAPSAPKRRRFDAEDAQVGGQSGSVYPPSATAHATPAASPASAAGVPLAIAQAKARAAAAAAAAGLRPASSGSSSSSSSSSSSGAQAAPSAPPVPQSAVELARARAAALAAQVARSAPSSALAAAGVAPVSGTATAARTASGGAPLPPPPLMDRESFLSTTFKPVKELKINEVSAKERLARPGDVAGAGAAPRAARVLDEKVLNNPYLAHLLPPAARSSATSSAGDATPGSASVTSEGAPNTSAALLVDPRLAAAPERRRAARSAKGLHFTEGEGKFTRQAEILAERAAAAAAYAAYKKAGSRLRPVHREEGEEEGDAGGGGGGGGGGGPLPPKRRCTPIYPAGRAPAGAMPTGGSVVPVAMEWWDAAFLPPAKYKDYSRAVATGASTCTELAGAPPPSGGSADDDQAMASAAASEAGAMPGTRWVPRFSYAECAAAHARTLNLIQHPVPLRSAADAAAAAAPAVVPLMLTKKERKRVRRQQRAIRHKELTDAVRLGLLPPPEPKVRLSNLMRVLTDAAVANPSAVEAQVRAQVEARIRSHEARNAAKKLTPAERRAKWQRKMKEHGAEGPSAALFRVPHMRNAKVRFRVEANAGALLLSGCVMEVRMSHALAASDAATAATTGYALVYVEGGTRAVRRFVHVMHTRINWRSAAALADAESEEEGSDGSDDSDGGAALHSRSGLSRALLNRIGADEATAAALAAGSDGRVSATGYGSGVGSLCECVWRGTAPARYFDKFSFEEARTASAARKALDAKGLAHLWDAVAHSAAVAGVNTSASAPASSEASSIAGVLASLRASFAAGGFLQHALAQPAATQQGDASMSAAGAAAAAAAAAEGESDSDESDSEGSSDESSDESEAEQARGGGMDVDEDANIKIVRT